jgi:hypothetical protein
MTPNKASASDFLPSVIVAVATASASTKDPVHWNTVLPAWKSLTGLDESSFGDDKRGYPRVLTAISTAWSSAKKKGFAAPSPRRTYALTDKGLEYARSNGLIPAKPPVEDEPSSGDIVETAPAEIDASIPPVTDGPLAGVRFDPASKFTAEHGDPVYEDAYFRGLAIDATRCFGRFSPRASTCKTCPLAKWCASAVVANMASVVASLEAPVETTPEPVEETPAEATAPIVGNACTIEFEAPCEKCGEIIAEGSPAIHVPGKGVYHTHCASET